jgi:predicted DNA-binding protein with PD1-like motif
MHARELTANGQTATFALVFDGGDEVIETLTAWCRAKGVTAARFTGIGALSGAVLAWFDWKQRQYREIPVDEQVELLSLSGDVAEHDGQASIHAHAVLGKRDGNVCGGHLIKAHVRPTVELILDTVPSHLRKQHDRDSGLALIALSK